MQDKPALMKSFYKWLKPGGKVLISDYCRSGGTPTDEFAEYIKQRGYDLHDVKAYGQASSTISFTPPMVSVYCFLTMQAHNWFYIFNRCWEMLALMRLLPRIAPIRYYCLLLKSIAAKTMMMMCFCIWRSTCLHLSVHSSFATRIKYYRKGEGGIRSGLLCREFSHFSHTYAVVFTSILVSFFPDSLGGFGFNSGGLQRNSRWLESKTSPELHRWAKMGTLHCQEKVLIIYALFLLQFFLFEIIWNLEFPCFTWYTNNLNITIMVCLLLLISTM